MTISGKSRRSAITPEVVKKVLELHRAGVPPTEVSRQLDLSRMEVVTLVGHNKMRFETARPEDEPHTEVSVEPLAQFDNVPPTELVVETDDDTEDANGIFLGDDVEYQTPVYWRPQNTKDVQNPHLMIMGESGSGKTYATQCLIAELARAGIPSIVFDFGQGFELQDLDPLLKKHLDVKEHPIGEQGLSLNPLQIFDRDVQGPNTVATRLADIFDAAFRLGDIQRKVLIDAAINAYDRVGIAHSSPATWQLEPPSADDFRQVLDELSSDKDYSSAKNALSLSARLTTFFMLTQFRTDKMWSWSDFVGDGKINILQFRGLEGKTQKVLVEMLLWHLFFHLKGGGQNTLKLYCVLDEAHHLSFRDSGPVNALLREARKFGLGLIFASQQPADFSNVAYSNTASKVIFQIADPGLKVARLLAPKITNVSSPEEIRDTVGDLPRGRGLFITRNRSSLVDVASFPKRATFWSAPTS